MSRAHYVAPAAAVVGVKPAPPGSPLARYVADAKPLRSASELATLAREIATAADDVRVILRVQELPSVAAKCPRVYDYWLADFRVLLARAAKKAGVAIRTERMNGADGEPGVLRGVHIWRETPPAVPKQIAMML